MEKKLRVKGGLRGLVHGLREGKWVKGVSTWVKG
jgi:hypothetical protein